MQFYQVNTEVQEGRNVHNALYVCFPDVFVDFYWKLKYLRYLVFCIYLRWVSCRLWKMMIP